MPHLDSIIDVWGRPPGLRGFSSTRSSALVALPIRQKHRNAVPPVARPGARADFVSAPAEQFLRTLRLLPGLMVVSHPHPVSGNVVHPGDINQIPLLAIV